MIKEKKYTKDSSHYSESELILNQKATLRELEIIRFNRSLISFTLML